MSSPDWTSPCVRPHWTNVYACCQSEQRAGWAEQRHQLRLGTTPLCLSCQDFPLHPARIPPPPPCVDMIMCANMSAREAKVAQTQHWWRSHGYRASCRLVSTSFLATRASECAYKVWSCLSKFSLTLDTRGGKSSWYEGEGPVYGISLGYPYQSCQREWASDIPKHLMKCTYNICLLTFEGKLVL